jgi:hypothetical protein
MKAIRMKQNRIEEGRLSDRGEGLGTVTREMVMKRAREIAVINGRSQNNVLDSDIEQARRELEGEDEMKPAPTAGENLPEDKRWDPVPGTEGRRAPTVPAPDEQTFAEKVYDEGVADAEHDQEIQATRDQARRDNE